MFVGRPSRAILFEVKLWTTIGLERLPEILKNGFDNPYSDEIHFWNDASIGADNALSFPGELAFIEAEIPDDQFEGFFAPCMGSMSDAMSDAESELEYVRERKGDASEEIAQLEKDLRTINSIDTARDSLDLFGYACLVEVIPTSMLKLLDLEAVMEAVHTGDAESVAHAVQSVEATAFKTLGAAFWVWLMMLMGQIFGPGYGVEQDEPEEDEESEEKVAARAEAQRRQFKVKRKKGSTIKKSRT
jgi:hypothetical protein